MLTLLWGLKIILLSREHYLKKYEYVKSYQFNVKPDTYFDNNKKQNISYW